MPVRNPLRAGATGNFPMRKVFLGDLASVWNPDSNPAPTTARGKRRIQHGKAKPAARPQLLVGLAHRPHVTNSGKESGIRGTSIHGHGHNEAYTRFVSLVHGRRVYPQ